MTFSPPRGGRSATPDVGRTRYGVRRYRETHQSKAPASWRTCLPRVPLVHLPIRLVTLALVLVVGTVASRTAYDHHHSKLNRASTFLATADAEMRAAAQAPDPSTAELRLTTAEQALDRAAGLGAASRLVATKQLNVAAVRDQARGVVRLQNVTRTGSLPPSLAGRPLRLALDSSGVYVVAGDLYHLDVDGRQLVQVLTSGTRVSGSTVGPLLDAAVDDERLTVTDGARVYARDRAGKWRADRLGLLDDQAWTITTAGVFQGNVYFLHPQTGQILKFRAGDLTALPDIWSASSVQSDLTHALDMVVDGSVYVLMPDGRLLTFRRGALKAPLVAPVVPPLAHPVALFGQRDTNFLYIVDIVDTGENGGRIIRVSRDGQQAEQWLAPQDDPAARQALATARDVVVDEATGTVYFATADALWQATVPHTDRIAQR